MNIASRIFTTIRPSRRSVPEFRCSAISRASATSIRLQETCATGFLPANHWATPPRPHCKRIETSRLPVSVHVRRGDYLKPGTHEVHGILGESYYRQVFDRLESMIGQEAELFIFSDDPAAAEQVLGFIPGSRLNHVRGDPERPWEDMALMARCRHHVIANSSFSWWGAWLNPSSGQDRRRATRLVRADGIEQAKYQRSLSSRLDFSLTVRSNHIQIARGVSLWLFRQPARLSENFAARRSNWRERGPIPFLIRPPRSSRSISGRCRASCWRRSCRSWERTPIR